MRFKANPYPVSDADKKIGVASFLLDIADRLELVEKYRGDWKDKQLSLTIDIWKDKRSLSANDCFHAICDKIGHFQGCNPESIKLGLKEIYGVWQTENAWVKNMMIPRRNLKSTAKYNTAEMSRLIDGAILEANEMGCDIRQEATEWASVKKE